MQRINDQKCPDSEYAESWRELDWKKITNEVIAFQRRIVSAYKESNFKELAILERLVTNSFCAKALAVLTVTKAKGARTAGVDDQSWKSDSQKYQAIMQLQPDNYAPSPYLRIYIPKPQGGLRPISIPTMTDRAMQTLYKLVMEPIAECSADRNSFAYRRWRSPHDAIVECHRLLLNGAEWVIEGDIKGCFDNISHEWLLANIPMNKDVLRKMLKCGYSENRCGSVQATDVGVSQGGPLSQILCNLTLDGMSALVKQQDPGMEIIRYADDFIIAGNDLTRLMKLLPALSGFLAERGLALSEEKTTVTSVYTGFDFLGYRFQKHNGNIKTKPSAKSVNRILAKLHYLINENNNDKANTAERVNAAIRGWANYHCYSTERGAFLYIDLMTNEYIRQSRMPSEILNSMIAASEAGKERLIPALPSANPFDEDWRLYFEEWTYARRFHTRKGRSRLEAVYSRQGGICPVCNKTLESEFSIHEKDGCGGSVIELLHPECHSGVHKS